MHGGRGGGGGKKRNLAHKSALGAFISISVLISSCMCVWFFSVSVYCIFFITDLCSTWHFEKKERERIWETELEIMFLICMSPCVVRPVQDVEACEAEREEGPGQLVDPHRQDAGGNILRVSLGGLFCERELSQKKQHFLMYEINVCYNKSSRNSSRRRKNTVQYTVYISFRRQKLKSPPSPDSGFVRPPCDSDSAGAGVCRGGGAAACASGTCAPAGAPRPRCCCCCACWRQRGCCCRRRRRRRPRLCAPLRRCRRRRPPFVGWVARKDFDMCIRGIYGCKKISPGESHSFRCLLPIFAKGVLCTPPRFCYL